MGRYYYVQGPMVSRYKFSADSAIGSMHQMGMYGNVLSNTVCTYYT